AILNQFVAYLIRENYGESITFGRFESKYQNLDDQLKQAKIFESLTSMGYMSPKLKQHSNTILKTMGLSELDDAQFKEIKKYLDEAEPKSKMDNSDKSNLKESNNHYKNRSVTDVN